LHCLRLVDLCRRHNPNIWLVFDETYHEFYYEKDVQHYFPNSNQLNYEHIVHLFSFSKTFGMPGWRVGFLVFPEKLTNAMRKLQDANPTHPAMISQKLALEAMRKTYSIDPIRQRVENSWFQSHLNELTKVRESLFPILQPLGTVKPMGAYYFLVPLPPFISEEEAVELLALKFGVLLMTGSPFGAKNHLRLSYGGVDPEKVMNCVEQLRAGLNELQRMSNERVT
jgi:aspartate/methionine/tyrosine aminotransferase